MTDKIRVNGKALDYVDEGDIAELTDHIAFACRTAGLRGHALDVAISRALTAIVGVIEDERGIDERRRETIRQVQ